MTQEEIVAQLAKERFVEGMLKGIARTDILSPDQQDLCQMVYLALLEYKGEGRLDIAYMWEHKRMKYFIARILICQYYGKTSPFYYQLRRFAESMREYDGHEKADE